MKSETTRTDRSRIVIALALALALWSLFAGQHVQAQAVETDPPVQAESVSLPEATNVSVQVTPNRSTLAVGDPVQLTVEVIHPAGYQVFPPELDPIWGDLEVREQSPAVTVANADGTETTRQTIAATLFAPGQFRTSPLPITVSDAGGNLSQAYAAPVELAVESVLVEGDSQLRDIKPQAALPIPSDWALMAVAGLLAVGLAGVVGWWSVRHSRRVAVDNRPPHQVAYDELDRIAELGHAEAGRFKLHYGLITDCLRSYLEQQYEVPAMDRTTGELKNQLRAAPMSSRSSEAFVSLLDESDLVKFADFAPSLETARRVHLQARTLVAVTADEVETARIAAEEAAAQAKKNRADKTPAPVASSA